MKLASINLLFVPPPGNHPLKSKDPPYSVAELFLFKPVLRVPTSRRVKVPQTRKDAWGNKWVTEWDIPTFSVNRAMPHVEGRETRRRPRSVPWRHSRPFGGNPPAGPVSTVARREREMYRNNNEAGRNSCPNVGNKRFRPFGERRFRPGRWMGLDFGAQTAFSRALKPTLRAAIRQEPAPPTDGTTLAKTVRTSRETRGKLAPTQNQEPPWWGEDHVKENVVRDFWVHAKEREGKRSQIKNQETSSVFHNRDKLLSSVDFWPSAYVR